MTKKQLFFHYQKYIIPYIPKSVLSLAAGTICLLLGMAAPLITKVLIDYAYPNRDLFLLTFLIGAGVIIFLLTRYFSSIESYLDMYTSNHLSVKLRERFFGQLQKLSLKFHGERQVGDLIFRLNDDIEMIVSMATQLIATTLHTLFQLVFLLFICFRFDWQLTCLALTGIPIYFLETWFFAKKKEAVREKMQKQQSEVSSFLQERLPAVKMIKLFGREVFETEVYGREIKKLFFLIRESHIVTFLNSLADSTISRVWIALLSWYAGYHVITGVLSIGELMAVTAYVFQLYGPFMQFGDIYKFVIEGMVSAKRVHEVLAASPEIVDAPNAKDLAVDNGEIVLRNVSFAYRSEKKILQDVSLQIGQGKSVALVGPSGAGKTTFTDLIARLYDPDQGTILIDGVDIKTVTQASLRRVVSIVNQEITLFRATIKENIRYGDATVSDELVIKAAKMANAHDFIQALPQGYDTLLHEHGRNLSGGQRQRLTIARALLRDPRILILDEATSAIDPESEEHIHDALRRFKQGRTVISIAHKLSTIIDSDEILFFENGVIGERGSFSELMQKKGRFSEFFRIEFGGFRYFSDRLSQEILRVKRYKRPFSLVMLEINDLPMIASRIGEEKLSAVLFEVEECIVDSTREVDFSARYHKDRFLLGLPETNNSGGRVAAQRIVSAIQKYIFLVGGGDIRLDAHVGVSSIGEDASTITELYRNAEKMLEQGEK